MHILQQNDSALLATFSSVAAGLPGGDFNFGLLGTPCIRGRSGLASLPQAQARGGLQQRPARPPEHARELGPGLLPPPRERARLPAPRGRVRGALLRRPHPLLPGLQDTIKTPFNGARTI